MSCWTAARWVNGLVNAAWSRGLGCVAMGYPDEEFPANAVVSRRRPVADVASFVGFEEAPKVTSVG